MAAELPQELIDSLQTVTGFDETSFRNLHAPGNQLVSIRVNTARVATAADIPFLQNVLGDKVSWSSNGYYLTSRPVFTLDPLFHAGAYYVQEASSMFLEQAVSQACDVSGDLHVLDLCAAPGGKSTLLQNLLTPGSLLVSNEVIKTRAGILAENITKWGAANVVVTNNDPKDFKRLSGFFDCIVVDAPCSGSGMFRKDPAAISEWSLANVDLCSQRQQRILADIYDSLKPGGTLIYSTCSYSIEEDEAIADWVKDTYDVSTVRFDIDPHWGVVETMSVKNGCFGYRFYPGKVKGEGFFIAAFKKNSGDFFSYDEKKVKLKSTPASKEEARIAAGFLSHPDNFSFLKWQQEILAVPSLILPALLQVQQHLYIKKAAVNMGTIIRNELIPSHELILSTILANKFPVIPVSEETALDYLRKKDIQIDTVHRGWAIVSYQDLFMGLVKILPNRLNNYYPKEWRILNK